MQLSKSDFADEEYAIAFDWEIRKYLSSKFMCMRKMSITFASVSSKFSRGNLKRFNVS